MKLILILVSTLISHLDIRLSDTTDYWVSNEYPKYEFLSVLIDDDW